MSKAKNFLEHVNDEAEKSEQAAVVPIESHYNENDDDIDINKEHIARTQHVNHSNKHKSRRKEGKVSESFAKETFQYQKRKINMPFILLLVLMIISSGIVYYLYNNQGFEMVNLVGVTEEDAYTWADNQGVLIVSITDYSEEIVEGKVISQSIDPGEVLQGNETIRLTVSEGLNPNAQILIPDFDNSWSRLSVISWLNEQGIDNFNIVTVVSEVEEDFLVDYRIIGTDPAEFNRSSMIEFTFSMVDDTTTVIMSNFIGQNISTFDIWARNESLQYEVTYEYNEMYDENSIIAQNVNPNDEITIDTVISLVVSQGTDTNLVTVPSFVGWNERDFNAWCQDQLMNYTVSYEYNELYSKNQIIAQNIQSNEEISRDTILNIVVSLGEGLLVTDFTSSVESDFDRLANEFDGTVIKEFTYSEQVEKDGFVSQSVAPNTYIEQEHILYVTYSLGDKVMIPDFRSLNSVDIILWIEEVNNQGGSLEYTIIEDENLQGSYGTIFEQSQYLDFIDIDSEIEIVISVENVIQDFSKMSVDEANYMSQYAEYPIQIIEIYQQGTEVGEYIGQSINEGEKVTSTTYLTITYSLGNQIRLDDYVGESLAELQEFVEGQNSQGANLQIHTNEVFNDEIPKGYIISQSPSNFLTHTNQLIDILVSKGEKYTVENFYSMTKDQIEFFADQNNLNVVFIMVDSSKIATNRVVSMSPEAGSDISKDDIIYIEIAN